MKPQKGQILIVQRYFKTPSDTIEIIAEAGNDTGKSFLGKFIVKIKKTGVFKLMVTYSSGEYDNILRS